MSSHLLISRESFLWMYLTEEIRGLIEDTEVLVHESESNITRITDFSYLVFPLSKAYEGFLKLLFLDLGILKEDEFYSEDIRIGKILNPNYMREKGSLFDKLCHAKNTKKSTASVLWAVWRKGRNQVFHYFPHNFRRLSYKESLEIIEEIIAAMNMAVTECKIKVKP